MPDASPVTGATESPDVVKSSDGALGFYEGVLELYGKALYTYAFESGELTDELRPLFVNLPPQTNDEPRGLDPRSLPDGSPTSSFQKLQILRANARQARWALAEYAPAAPKDLRGHLYAIEGLADVLLADLYCSGIPLSTVNPDGTFTLAAGSSTQDVYHTAVALFDSALAFTSDSVRIRDFAHVGMARALLALGQADSAAAVVTSVPTDYTYLVTKVIDPTVQQRGMFDHPDGVSYALLDGSLNSMIMSDAEGETGLPYATSGDPRTAADTGTSVYDIGVLGDTAFLMYPRYFARKYAADGTTPMVVASGVEARLIEAEAQLRKGQVEAWAQTLDALRATAGIASLPADSTTNASPALRVKVLFAERAYWLFLTGHRQGDLRRLVRRQSDGGYGVLQDQVYPTGPYPTGQRYGSDVTAPVPPEELAHNSKYNGCRNRDA